MTDHEKYLNQLNKIKKKLNDIGGTYFFYDINRLKEKKFTVAVIGINEDDSREKLNLKLEKEPNKYGKDDLVSINVYISEDNIGRTDFLFPACMGAIKIHVNEQTINRFNRIILGKNYATFYYPDDQIENFSIKHIKKIIKIVKNGLVNNNPFNAFSINQIDEILKKNKKKKIINK